VPTPPKRLPDTTVTLSDTSTLSIEDYADEPYELTALYGYARPDDGGNGTLVKLRDALLLSGCPVK